MAAASSSQRGGRPKGGGTGRRSSSPSATDGTASSSKSKSKKSSPSNEAERVAQLKLRLSSIRNRQRRQQSYQLVRAAERKAKVAAARARRRGDGAAATPGVPHTLETLRLPDRTMPDAMGEAAGAEAEAELAGEEAGDEFADIINGERQPRVLITHADGVRHRTVLFCRGLRDLLPNADFCRRRRLPLGKIISGCRSRGYTALLVIAERNRSPCTALLCHLPAGPTLTFRVSNVRLTREMRVKGWDGKRETVLPQVLCNRFHTRLGRRVARSLAALFPCNAGARRHARCVTFHNQRDYVFFRHHRYILQQQQQQQPQQPRLALQEVGPRFTLKLRSLQSGVMDTRHGLYEWLHKRHEMDSSRRRFHL